VIRMDNGHEEKMSACYILGKDILSWVENTALFYPSCGNDTSVPIQLFSPFVTDFWFVDRGYFCPGNQDTKHYGLDKPADEQEPILSKDKSYRLINTAIDGPPIWAGGWRDLEPCILTELYLHVPTNRNIRIHRRRGFGFSAFRKLISSLGVFFYRGDSPGEGGSGNLWLKSEHLKDVCNKLKNGGLIVTDGSQQGGARPYRELCKYFWQNRSMTGEELIKSVKPFTDSEGRIFTCVGYAGHRYGPTLIWQVIKTVQQSAELLC
jgi:hypothetical protein